MCVGLRRVQRDRFLVLTERLMEPSGALVHLAAPRVLTCAASGLIVATAPNPIEDPHDLNPSLLGSCPLRAPPELPGSRPGRRAAPPERYALARPGRSTAHAVRRTVR